LKDQKNQSAADKDVQKDSELTTKKEFYRKYRNKYSRPRAVEIFEGVEDEVNC